MRLRVCAGPIAQGVSSRKSATFSHTVNAGIKLKFWNTMPTPRRRASRGEAMRAGRPETRISPASGR